MPTARAQPGERKLSSCPGKPDELSDHWKKSRDEQGNFALTPRGKTYRAVGVIFATKPPNGL
jgi:hypothetical protein